ncbi:hypothetical protein BMETH_1181_2 [methanotrophic bacterial endosymbiont of Bathymodiolus sp.]|nr:hypothetical protein BMETH_1181_2 [methanotrophic bacterial endosymbiont of Bathymodiolus sp.]
MADKISPTRPICSASSEKPLRILEAMSAVTAKSLPAAWARFNIPGVAAII